MSSSDQRRYRLKHVSVTQNKISFEGELQERDDLKTERYKTAANQALMSSMLFAKKHRIPLLLSSSNARTRDSISSITFLSASANKSFSRLSTGMVSAEYEDTGSQTQSKISLKVIFLSGKALLQPKPHNCKTSFCNDKQVFADLIKIGELLFTKIVELGIFQ